MASLAIWSLCILAIVPAIQAGSHYVYAPYKQSYSTITCTYPWSCTKQDFSVNLQTRTCETGWVGCKCDIPICTPACSGDAVCITPPSTCGCLKTGTSVNTNCPYTQCQNGKDCYPGTCSENGTYCVCPPGFSGDNCQNITATPIINPCTVKVYDTGFNLVKQAVCAGSGYDASVNWIPNVAINQIQTEWLAQYVDKLVLPGNAVNYVNGAPVQISVNASRFEVAIIVSNKTASPPQAQKCNRPDLPCDVNVKWVDLGIPAPEHNMTFKVTAFANLGGQKQVTRMPNSTFYNPLPLPLPFNGTEVTRSAIFRFDLVPPVHCLSSASDSTNGCPYFAIYLDQDIRSNPVVQPKFYNWTDDGSGISAFQINVYTMGVSGDALENTGDPIVSQTVDPILNNAIFTLRDPGVYSIELTVFDQAGNKARARKLFIYNPISKINTNPNSPVHLQEADPPSYKWLTRFDDPRNGGNIPLTVMWENHFSSSAQYQDTWSKGAKPWLPSAGIDDRFGSTYGRRSIEPLPKTSGITSYALTYYVDQSGGGKGLAPYNWITLASTVTSFKLPINESLADGNTIVVWLQCTDAAASNANETLVIGVDRTPPVINQQRPAFKTGSYGTNTNVYVTVVDRESGILQISYQLFVSGLLAINVTIASQRVAAPPASTRYKRNEPVQTYCKPGDSTCFCTPQGDCFNTTQVITIDNCDIDRYAGQYFVIRYTVFNGANQPSIEQSIDLGFLSADQIPCRPLNGPLSGGAIAGIVIGVILGVLLLILLIFIICLLFRIYYFKKPVPRRIEQTFRRMKGRSYNDENVAYESRGGGALTSAANAAKRLSARFSMYDVKKANQKMGDGNDEYIYTGSEALRNNSTHIQRKYLDMDEIISNEGRFAVIKKARLQDKNGSKVVAVKALRSGFSAADVKLMEQKIEFFNDLQKHANIVNFLGASEEENNGGPIMILEFCEIPLKEWLKNNKKVTSEVLEYMLTFTLNIARGVEHLHSNMVIHRRLAVRNVLLTNQFGGLVAKLIGFGPNREDNDDKKAAVPVKWLAPETLSTIDNPKPTYNEKTDAWSFGITVWEIYSLGETPYPNKKSNEAKKLIIKGLKPTKPDECPEDLYQSAIQPCWESNPQNRPSFPQICSAIEDFRRGSPGTGGEGYYTSDPDYREGAYAGIADGEEFYTDGR